VANSAVGIAQELRAKAGKPERQDLAIRLLRGGWDVAGVVDVRDRLSYPVRR